MSVLNLITQSDSAYLITDSGVWDGDGQVCELVDKRIVLSKFNVAISATGRGAIGQLFPIIARACVALEDRPCFPFQTFIDFVRWVYEHHGVDPETSSSVWAAISYDEGQPSGCLFFTSSKEGGPGEQPWQWYPKRALAFPRFDAHAALGKPRDITDRAVFNVAEEAMNIVDAQRNRRGVNGSFHAAGKIRLTTVSARGLEEVVLHDYQDTVRHLS